MIAREERNKTREKEVKKKPKKKRMQNAPVLCSFSFDNNKKSFFYKKVVFLFRTKGLKSKKNVMHLQQLNLKSNFILAVAMNHYNFPTKITEREGEGVEIYSFIFIQCIDSKMRRTNNISGYCAAIRKKERNNCENDREGGSNSVCDSFALSLFSAKRKRRRGRCIKNWFSNLLLCDFYLSVGILLLEKVW